MTAPSRAGGLSALRLRPLAACLAATMAAVAPGHGAAQVASVNQTATIVVVQNCNDSGAGSLRAAYANAVDNETIDLTQLVCSHITLGSALTDPVAAANVTLLGPGKDLLTIDGDNLYRVLVHRGNSSLHVDHVTIANGYYRGAHGGGCIYSNGGVEATGSVVSSCEFASTGSFASGGAIYARGVVDMFDGTVRDSKVNYVGNPSGGGGGIYSVSGIVMSDSTVSGNTATKGGGIFSRGNVINIQNSTISGNHAIYGGGVFAKASTTIVLGNSTISGNDADFRGGGIYAYYSINVYNCTVVKNRAASPNGAGIFLVEDAHLNSSIIANNTTGDGLVESDVGGSALSQVTGANNLIMAAEVPVPGSITIDPKLGPLQDNGGATQTHALLPGSPAIGKGNNALALDSDQRGAPFRRVDASRADIGAFEFADAIFDGGFDPLE